MCKRGRSQAGMLPAGTFFFLFATNESPSSVLFYRRHQLFTVIIFYVINKNVGQMTHVKGKIFNEIIFRGSGWRGEEYCRSLTGGRHTLAVLVLLGI